MHRTPPPAVPTAKFTIDRSVAGLRITYLIGAVFLAAGLYVSVSTILMVIHGWLPLPFWDQWDELILSPKQLFSPWLFSQHNEHRILFPRLLFAIDAFVFAGTNRFNFFCNVALTLALASLLIVIAHRHVSRLASDTMWIAGIVTTALFSAMPYENFLWGFQVSYFGVELASAASIGCLVFGRRRWASLTASICFSAIAVYTLASGMLVPFLAIPLGVWTRRSKMQIAVLAAAAGVLLISYLHGYVSPAEHSDPINTLLRLDVVHYAAAEIGNPFSASLQAFGVSRPASEILGLGFGALGLVLFGVAAVVLLRRGRAFDEAQLFFFAIAALGVGVSFLTAMGRLKFGAEQALSSRYASPMLLFWLSLALLAISEVQRHRPNLRPFTTGCTALAVLGLVVVQPAFVRTGLPSVAPRRAAVTALLANVEDDAAIVSVYPVPRRALRLAAKLRERHFAVFAEAWSTWLDTRLADHIRIGDAAHCRGDVDQATRLPGTGPAQWRVGGWAWDEVRETPVARIVVVNPAGRVVGYGLGGFPGKLGSGAPKHSGWRGHFTAQSAAFITAYALVDRDRIACPLRTWPSN